MIAGQTRQLVTQQRTCVAAALGPDGMLDGSLLFGSPGFVQIPDEHICRFALSAIPEGSRLRAWLRICWHSGSPVPWALCFVNQPTQEVVQVQGEARLVRETDAEQHLKRWMVEINVVESIHAMNHTIPTTPDPSSLDASVRPEDRAVRELVDDPATELSDPVRALLAEATLSFLCVTNGDGPPRIASSGGSPGFLATTGSDAGGSRGRVYVNNVGTGSGSDIPGSIDKTGHAMLIVPSYRARLAVRVSGSAEIIAASNLPQTSQNPPEDVARTTVIEVDRVEVQGGDWSALQVSANPRVSESVLRLHGARAGQRADVTFVSGPTVLVKDGESLLEVAEANGVPLEAGCRMGICGADPVQIVAGAENLSPVRRSEQSTLDRMGLPPGCRMACSARVHGSATVLPIIDPGQIADAAGSREPAESGFTVSPGVQRILVIGTGIAGITATEEIRKLHPGAEITILGAERYDFYNRMAISKLVDGETTIDKLSLMTRGWAERRRVRYLPGVCATSIDRERHEVTLSDGEPIPYDRLVLAMGARSNVPGIEGIDLDGTYVLRTIDDALQIQQYVHRHPSRRAVVIGGGLLGLEAAYHLSQAGARVWIVGRGDWPAERQIDEHAGTLLSQMLQDLGISYLARSEPRRLIGTEAVQGVELADGRTLEAGICLVTAGIIPDVRLAREAGLEVQRGIVVDDRMQTSDPTIYAAGDVIEYGGRVIGLWPASVDQGRVAAANLLGGEMHYNATMAPAQLKVPGIDLLSVGEIKARGPEDREVRLVDQMAPRYRKLVHRDGKAIGAIVIGYPELFDGVAEVVQENRDISARLDAIERGDWSSLTLDSDDEREDTLVVSRVG